METTDSLSIPNLVISGLILAVVVIGKALICRWVWLIQKEQRKIHEDIVALEKQIKALPPLIVGELQINWDLSAWERRVEDLEPRVELAERRLDALDGNGNNGERDG